MKGSRTGNRRKWAVGATVAVAAVGGYASGDVVLHPGTATGTAGLNGSSYTYGSINLSNGTFSASAPVTNNSYTLTTEGNQTYSNVNVSQYGYSNGQYQSMSSYRYDANIYVPVNGTVTTNMAIDGANLTTHIPVTGGTLASAYFYSNGSIGTVYYNGYAQGNGNDVTFMQPPTNVTIYGTAKINVFDVDGYSIKCTTDVSLASQTLDLTANPATTVTWSFTVDPSVCGQAVMRGDIGIHNAPGGVLPSYAQVSSGYPNYFYKYLSGYSAATPDLSYEFTGLSKAYHYPYVYMSFPAPYSGEYLYLPNQNPYNVDLTAGGTAQRDFVFDAGVVSGNAALTGPAAQYAQYRYRYFNGQYDYTQPHYGPTAGGYAGGQINLSSGDYGVVLTPGTWTESYDYTQFSRYTNGVSYYTYLYDYQYTNISIQSGQTLTAPSDSLSVSEGLIVFDVIEPPSSPVIGVTNPYVYARLQDASGHYHQIQSYTYVTNVDTPGVRLIGPPGEYSFDAYATVLGTNAKFASSTINIGTAVNTPTGTDVTIVPRDGSGNPTPITLDFEQVTGGGQTSVSTTDVGPAAPTGYELLKVIDDKQYINITTSAQFPTQVEICIQYDPTALGISSSEESNLKLQQYSCSSATSCDWTIINGYFAGDNGDVSVNASTHTICGLTTSLSTFAITRPDFVEQPPTDTCVGALNDPAQLTTDPGMCTAQVDNVNQSAGGCADGGSGLASCTFDGYAAESLGLGAHSVTVLGTSDDGSSSTCSSYVNVVDREAPTPVCPAATTVECTGPTTPVSLKASCSDNCGSCNASCGEASYSLGTQAVGCNASDDFGNHSSCSSTVTVVDTQAPSLSITSNPSTLWSPNHKLVAIDLAQTLSDTCDSKPAVSCSATSNEPDNGLGDGDKPDDIQWINGTLYLRAERSGTGTGRIYTITCVAKDASGNQKSATTTVTVPHDQ